MLRVGRLERRPHGWGAEQQQQQQPPPLPCRRRPSPECPAHATASVLLSLLEVHRNLIHLVESKVIGMKNGKEKDDLEDNVGVQREKSWRE